MGNLPQRDRDAEQQRKMAGFCMSMALCRATPLPPHPNPSPARPLAAGEEHLPERGRDAEQQRKMAGFCMSMALCRTTPLPPHPNPSPARPLAVGRPWLSGIRVAGEGLSDGRTLCTTAFWAGARWAPLHFPVSGAPLHFPVSGVPRDAHTFFRLALNAPSVSLRLCCSAVKSSSHS